MSLPHTAFVSLWFPKPSETFIFREAVRLREMGLPLTAYAHYGPFPRHLSPEMRAFDAVEHHGVRHLRHGVRDLFYWRRRNPAALRRVLREIPWRWYGDLELQGENLWALHVGLHFARRVAAQGVEHIHACWATGAATSAYVASTLTGVPFSFAARAGDIYPPEPALPWKLAQASFVRVNNAFNIDYLRGFAAKIPGLTAAERMACADKVTLVYNALTLNHGGEADLPMKPPHRFLAIGRFVPTKGFDYLLKALKMLKDEGMDWRLTLVGDGREREPLKRLAGELGLTERVTFPGYVTHERVDRLMLDADVFVMPCCVAPDGDRDGIPNVIMEAMAHTVPVVASDVAGVKEVVRDGETGRLTPQRDVPALAEALRFMTADRDRAKALAEAGRERVLRLFDPETNCRRLIELFSEHRRAPSLPAAT